MEIVLLLRFFSNTFSLPTRHILTLGQDRLAYIFNFPGPPLALGILLSLLNYILSNIDIIAYMSGCDISI